MPLNRKKTPAIAFMGTGSDVGKSQIVAGICRLLANRGIKIAPFKPQNMANNAMVANDGGEVGRAQALQAIAARVPLSHHFNPILLKPQAGVGSQIIAQGRNIGFARADEYYQLKPKLLKIARQSFDKIAHEYDVIIMEGAGSPAEVNLRKQDFANFGFARHYDIPTIMVADIERGGAIASLIGTYHCLTRADRSLIKGYIINKFRGLESLLTPAHAFIHRRTHWHNYGVVPHFPLLAQLAQEDSMALKTIKPRHQGKTAIAIIITPHIANFDDFNPLLNHPEARVMLVRAGEVIPPADWIIIMGSKSTIADGQFIINQGWHHDIHAHLRHGGRVMGICGGLQILGHEIIDSDAIDGQDTYFQGLGLLPISTRMQPQKIVQKQRAHENYYQTDIEFYEIHCGTSQLIKADDVIKGGIKNPRPFIYGQNLGFISDDGRVVASYCHGLFDNPAFLQQFFNSDQPAPAIDKTDEILDEWAGILENHLDIDRLLPLIMP